MFRSIAAVAVAAVCSVGIAHADPIPQDLIGAWTDLPSCGKSDHQMVFGASTVTIVENDGSRETVEVDTTGQPDGRLMIRVTKLPDQGGPDGPQLGDVLVMRREKELLHFVGHSEGGGPVRDEASGPVLHRCAS